jgi:hypothetical protein
LAAAFPDREVDFVIDVGHDFSVVGSRASAVAANWVVVLVSAMPSSSGSSNGQGSPRNNETPDSAHSAFSTTQPPPPTPPHDSSNTIPLHVVPAQPTSAALPPPQSSPAQQISTPQHTPHKSTNHPSHHSHHNGDNDAVSALSRSDVRDDDSLSGYSGQREDGATAYTQYYNRLVKFYLAYNPEKLNRVEEFLKAYRGEEEQLFTLLKEKYGPEPDPPRRNSVYSASDIGGPRALVPHEVPAEAGYTDTTTHYWPASKTVNDRDLCDVLETLQCTNQDLSSTYLGVLKEHPARATNGMTYVSTTPVSADGSRFLQHLWAGSLANNKILVHRGVQYHRTVLHCTEQCASIDSPHERWRLTMFRAEHTPNVLFRTIWDPEIQLDQPSFDEAANNNSFTRKGFQVQYATRRRPGSEAGGSSGAPPAVAPHPLYGANSGGGGATSPLMRGGQPPLVMGPPNGSHGHFPGPGGHIDPGAPPPVMVTGGTLSGSFDGASSGGMPLNYQQPQQPMALAPLELLLGHMQSMEARLMSRLHSIEERLMNVETALLDPDQPMQ